MTTLTFNVTREQAAEQLWVSTRTIDRYIKKGRLSYKKVANKVILASEEIASLAEEFSLLQQEPVSGVLAQDRVVPATNSTSLTDSPWLTVVQKSSIPVSLSWAKEFVELLQKKDQTIEEKNQMIYILQRKIGEMETQMKQMIALPEHTQEKDELAKTLQDLQLSKATLEEQIKKEKTMNVVFMWLAMLAIAILVFFALQ
jgi:excisionase family DNA binding protein